MDDTTKLAIVGGISGYTRVLCEAPTNADVEPGDSVIYERNDTQAVGTVINAIELAGAQGRAIADFIADWLDITRPFSRIVGAVQMFDWSDGAVDDDGDDGDADESADTAEPAPAPERDHGADAANSMDTGGATLGGVRAERTCRMEYNEYWSGDELYPTEAYQCSACGHITQEGIPHYCPKCGAKVVDE